MGSLVSGSLVGVDWLGSLLRIIYWGVINGNWGHYLASLKQIAIWGVAVGRY